MILLILSTLTGCIDSGVSRIVNTDAWTQPTREGGVDILWVVDDSASMYEERLQLELHAESFIGYLSAVPVDFSLAVTSTDMEVDYPGALLGPSLSEETPDLTAAFVEQIVHNSDGSRDEMGFWAAMLAADPDAGWGRETADLEVVFFTDEDDASEVTAMQALEALDADRQGTKIIINAIVGDPPEGCASLLAAANAGEKYIEAQELTEGLRESICALDYDAMLERIALQVLGLNTTFALSYIPSPESLEVRVDEVLVTERDRHGWRYEAGDNTIVFDGYAVPRPGAEIVVSYFQWVGPSEGGSDE
ncbi:MAG: hypothetical protein ACI8RZ_003788 [Myxococcota bacterium]